MKVSTSTPKKGSTSSKKVSTKRPESSYKKQKKENSEEGSSDVEEKYKKWRAENIVHPTISMRNLKTTYSLLDKKCIEPLNARKRKVYCRGEFLQPIAYDSTICLFRGVRRCILVKNWRALAELLRLLLYKPSKIYRPYVKRVRQNGFCSIM